MGWYNIEEGFDHNAGKYVIDGVHVWLNPYEHCGVSRESLRMTTHDHRTRLILNCFGGPHCTHLTAPGPLCSEIHLLPRDVQEAPLEAQEYDTADAQIETAKTPESPHEVELEQTGRRNERDRGGIHSLGIRQTNDIDKSRHGDRQGIGNRSPSSSDAHTLRSMELPKVRPMFDIAKGTSNSGKHRNQFIKGQDSTFTAIEGHNMFVSCHATGNSPEVRDDNSAKVATDTSRRAPARICEAWPISEDEHLLTTPKNQNDESTYDNYESMCAYQVSIGAIVGECSPKVHVADVGSVARNIGRQSVAERHQQLMTREEGRRVARARQGLGVNELKFGESGRSKHHVDKTTTAVEGRISDIIDEIRAQPATHTDRDSTGKGGRIICSNGICGSHIFSGNICGRMGQQEVYLNSTSHETDDNAPGHFGSRVESSDHLCSTTKCRCTGKCTISYHQKTPGKRGQGWQKMEQRKEPAVDTLTPVDSDSTVDGQGTLEVTAAAETGGEGIGLVGNTVSTALQDERKLDKSTKGARATHHNEKLQVRPAPSVVALYYPCQYFSETQCAQSLW